MWAYVLDSSNGTAMGLANRFLCNFCLAWGRSKARNLLFEGLSLPYGNISLGAQGI